MGWISNCLSCDQAGSHRFAIKRQGPRAVEEVLEMQAFCTMLLVCCLLSLGAGSAAAQADHDTKDRKLITRVEPEYPETLLRLYIGGIVRLEVTISARGDVENDTLLGGEPHTWTVCHGSREEVEIYSCLIPHSHSGSNYI